ncbi:GrpB family protein [Ruminococcus sp.]|uniref:GrpB family protein n=1 Tax=Ruminococcus sp. TaxID=41978 RepID=UPI0025E3E68C|nr:GrpB family protein [Ruminococcus sp.]
MKEHISELSPDEFQKTFPIELKDVISDYSEWYEEEKDKILSVLSENGIARINHIGSTAIPNIKAKPIVDILLEIDDTCHIKKLVEALKEIDFGTEILYRKEEPFELLMSKGMTVNGFGQRVFLLHIRYLGDWNELYFRDYLMDNPDIAEEYSNLKIQILKDINDGRIERMPNGKPNGYSAAKYAFVDDISHKAKLTYKNRYKI